MSFRLVRGWEDIGKGVDPTQVGKLLGYKCWDKNKEI